MKRVAFILQVKKDRLDAYKQHHLKWQAVGGRPVQSMVALEEVFHLVEVPAHPLSHRILHKILLTVSTFRPILVDSVY